MQAPDNDEHPNQETKSNSGGSSHNEESFFEDSDLDANYTESESNTSESDVEETVERGRAVGRARTSHPQRGSNMLRDRYSNRDLFQHRRIESIPENSHMSMPMGDYQPQWSPLSWNREQREVSYYGSQFQNSNEIMPSDPGSNETFPHHDGNSDNELYASSSRGHTRHMSLGDMGRGYFPTPDEQYDLNEQNSGLPLQLAGNNRGSGDRWDSFNLPTSPVRGYEPISSLEAGRPTNPGHSYRESLENTVSTQEYRSATGRSQHFSRNSVEDPLWESSREESRSSGSFPALSPLITHRTSNSLSTLKQQEVLEQFPSLTGHIDIPSDGPGQRIPQRQLIAANRVSTAAWEEEGTLCIVVELGGTAVTRRCDNNMINGTKLLNSAQISRGRRDGVLKGETVRHVVKVGVMDYKGVWIPFERALEMAKREKVLDDLYPLFVADLAPILYSPQNYARLRQIVTKANRRNPIFQQWLNGIPKQVSTNGTLPEANNKTAHSQRDSLQDRSTFMQATGDYAPSPFSHSRQHSQNRVYRGHAAVYERQGHLNASHYDTRYHRESIAYGPQFAPNSHNATHRHQRVRSQDTSAPHHEYPNHFQGPYQRPSSEEPEHESNYNYNQEP